MKSETASQDKALGALFLTLFLRGHSSRGLQKQTTPTSIAVKLRGVLGGYVLLGCFGLVLWGMPTLWFATMLHALTFMTLGMFLIVGAGETLFNKEEADILLHRPIRPQTLLRAKVSVLLKVSLYLALAVNLPGAVLGWKATSDGGPAFAFVHFLSATVEGLFCAGMVVLVYQLCTKWIGRERLEGFLTTAQVIMMVAITIGSQLMSRAMPMVRALAGKTTLAWWSAFLPPAWFAGFDDALAGSHQAHSWMLAALGVGITVLVVWLGFVKLADAYTTGMQQLSEGAPARPATTRRFRWLATVADSPPLCWFLRDGVTRSSFVLTVAYLFRDRDTKLRIWPSLAPYVVIPVSMLFTTHDTGRSGGAFVFAFSGAYMLMLPVTAYAMLKYSQQWRASEALQVAPLVGPFAICNGARMAVLVVLTLPMLVAYVIFAIVLVGPSALVQLLPGALALPLFSYFPLFGERSAPFSKPIEEARAARRAFSFYGVMLAAFGIAGLAAAAQYLNMEIPFLIIEGAVSVGGSYALKATLQRVEWQSAE